MVVTGNKAAFKLIFTLTILIGKKHIFSLTTVYLYFLFTYHRHFNLEQHIQFNTTVISVKHAPDFDTTGQWEVTTTNNGNSPQEITEIYDAVFVCSGMYKKPYIPEYPGLDEFEGRKVHTNEYRTAEPFKGKTVMVMGRFLVLFHLVCLFVYFQSEHTFNCQMLSLYGKKV